MEFQSIIDALTALEAKADALRAADELKVKNDAKAEAAIAAKAESDAGDVAAAGSVNDALNTFGTLVQQFVAANQMTR